MTEGLLVVRYVEVIGRTEKQELRDTTELEALPFGKENVGKNKQPFWFDQFLETMRKGETSLVCLELLKLDANGLKTLDKKLFY